MQLELTPEHVALFAAASRDHNPLHVSAMYARKTPFGEPVVFGALGVLACLAQAPGVRLRALTADFRGPMFAGVRYDVELDRGPPFRAKVYDGKRVLLQLSGDLTEVAAARLPGSMRAVDTRPLVARVSPPEALDGARVSGAYAPDVAAMKQLLALLGAGDAADATTVALLFASYAVGMELPGRDALFARLALTFDGAAAEPLTDEPLAFALRVAKYDRRFARVTTHAELGQGGKIFARGVFDAYVREPARALTGNALDEAFPESQRFAGKVALVVGGSRGLGACLTAGLARGGARVAVSFHKSEEEASAVKTALGRHGEAITLHRGDAADSAHLTALARDLHERYGRLDYLFLSACRAVLPLKLHPSTAPRVADYVRDSLALVASPLAAFAEALATAGGACVTLSSSYATEFPAEWPHYVAAKCAIEGLVQAVAKDDTRVRHLLVRPPRLLTDLTNSPLSRAGGLAPETCAARILDELTRARSGPVGVIDTFD